MKPWLNIVCHCRAIQHNSTWDQSSNNGEQLLGFLVSCLCTTYILAKLRKEIDNKNLGVNNNVSVVDI